MFILFRSKDVEKSGTGFQRVNDFCKQQNVTWNYRKEAYGFFFEFIRTNVQINVQINTELTEAEQGDFCVCSSMWRESSKYPVRAWSIDSHLDSRTGSWQNNQKTLFLLPWKMFLTCSELPRVDNTLTPPVSSIAHFSSEVCEKWHTISNLGNLCAKNFSFYFGDR